MDSNDFQRKERTPRIWSGTILLISGILLLAYKIGAPIPSWIFSWPMLLILIGILTGIKSRFHNPGAFVVILVGSVFLVDRITPALNFQNYIFPAILIGMGIIHILKPKNTWSSSSRDWRQNLSKPSDQSNYFSGEEATDANLLHPQTSNLNYVDDSEYVDINAVFGGVKKIILSKNFKGGEINSFMGGTELNLVQADIKQPIMLVVNNIFGGTKLLVPSNWDIKNELTAIFGGIEDKRSMTSAMPDPGKTVILKGACVFGGIEVSNF